MNQTLEELNQIIAQKIDKEEDITQEKIITVVIEWFRKQIYKEFPATDPKVVEALLLTYRNFTIDLGREIDQAEDEDLDSVTERLKQESRRFGSAITKTLKTMN